MRRLRRALLGAIALGGTAAGGLLWWMRRDTRGAPPPPQPARAAGNPEGPLLSRPTWDFIGILGTGQSLSIGAKGTPVLSTEPAFGNLKLSLGEAVVPPFDAESPELSLVPLCEPIRRVGRLFPEGYPGNLRGETPHTAMAHQISTLARLRLARDCVTVHSVVGESGRPMKIINRDAVPRVEGGLAWAASVFEVRAINRLAKARGKRYGVGAVVLTHGEADAERAAYARELYRLWQDYNRDLLALTGQSELFPLLASQQCSAPRKPGVVGESTLAVWRAALEHPERLVCTGPKYQYEYDDDGVHLTARSYARLGEKYGQVFFQHVLEGRSFRPLQPQAVVRTGNTLRATFSVPVLPLRWDSSLPAPHPDSAPEWRLGRGFEVLSGARRVEILGTELAGPETVVLQLRPDAPAALELRYAAAGQSDKRRGGTWRWGQLCDSDPFVGSLTGTAQPNYAVTFALPVA